RLRSPHLSLQIDAAAFLASAFILPPSSFILPQNPSSFILPQNPSSELALRQPAALEGVADDVRPIAQAEFFHAPPAVGLDRPGADVGLGGDLLERVALGDEPEDLGLPLAQVGAGPEGAGFPPAHQAGDELTGDGRVEVGLAGRDGPDGPDQVFAGSLLEH